MHSVYGVAAYIQEAYSVIPIDVRCVTTDHVAVANGRTIDEIVRIIGSGPANSLRDLAEPWDVVGDIFTGNERRKLRYARGPRLG